MDALERLKKDWNNNDQYPKVSTADIFNIQKKKSSSVVKWIFILSLAEFGFWTIISFFLKDSKAEKQLDSYGVDFITIPLMAIGYIILAYFFIQFYKNYTKISNTDSVKSLMEKILKTRRTVRHYVIFNLIFLYISVIIGIGIELQYNTDFILLVKQNSESGNLYIFYGIIILVTIVVLAIISGLLLGFYYLVYGILLKRLKKNYKKLQKLVSK